MELIKADASPVQDKTKDFKLIQEEMVKYGHVKLGHDLANYLVPTGWTRLNSMVDFWTYMRDSGVLNHQAIFVSPINRQHAVYQFSMIGMCDYRFIDMQSALQDANCIALGIFIQAYLGDLHIQDSKYYQTHDVQWTSAWLRLREAQASLTE